MMYPITNKISSKPLTFFHNDREDIDYKAEHGNKTQCVRQRQSYQMLLAKDSPIY